MTEAKEVIAESNGEENNKNEDNGEEETELDSEIIRQMEYYFGDLNLPRDKFLREQVQLDDGWVPFDILMTFNRLAKLTTDTAVLVKALNKATSGLLEISEDEKKVRRNPELPVPEMNEERRKELSSRTIYVKGFPKNAILDDLLTHFKQFEGVENFIMRKYQDRATKKRLFKGSIFVTFKTKEQAEKFLDTKNLKYNEAELILLWQEEYLQQKQEEYNSKKQAKENRNKQKEKDGKGEKEGFKLPTGSLLRMTEGADTMTREDIKDALAKLGAEIAYVDFKLGDKEGWVRLTKADSAKVLAEKFTDGKVKIGDNDVVFKVVEGDEEKSYFDKIVEDMSKRRKHMKNFKHKNSGRKGKQGKKRRNEDDDGPPKKVKAADS